MKKVVVYTRVSTKKDEQAESRVVQEAVYREYCNEKGYELYNVYGDSETGTNVRRRKEFIQMLHDAGLDYVRSEGEEYDSFKKSNRKPKFDLIIVKDVSRWSRSQHLGMVIVEYLKDKGVHVLFETAGVHTEQPDYKLRLSILFTVAENESEATSKRIKFSKQHRAKQGVYKPARVPYGFMRDEEKNIVVKEEEADVIRMIFKLAKEKGGRLVAFELNELGYKTQTGKIWDATKVQRLIRNTVYYGSPTVNMTTRKNVTDTYKTKVDKKDHIIIEDAVEAIIPFKEWKEVNDILDSRINKASNRGRRPHNNDIYYGKLKCSKCGSNFTRHIGVGNKISYICQKRRKGLGCDVRSISANIITDFLSRVHTNDIFNDTLNNTGYIEILNKLEEEKSQLVERRNSIEYQISKIQEENAVTLTGIKKQLKEGSQAVIDMLSQDIEENESRIKELEDNLKKLNMNAIFDLENKVEKKKHIIEEIQFDGEISDEEKLKLLQKIEVNDNECTMYFNFPNFKDEILEYNSIFTENPIHSSKGQQFVEHFRREHKEAREYWAELDEYGIDEHDRGFIQTGENTTQEAKDIEDMLDEASKL